MKIERLLSIILILINKGSVTGHELAEHFGVSLRTIYRDIDEISRTMVPIYAESGKGGGYRVMEGYKLDKTLLTRKDIAPLFSVMKGLKTILGKNDSFNNTLLKLEALYGSQENNQGGLVINMSRYGEEDTVQEALGLIREAIENSRCLVFGYTNRKFDSEERTIEPIQLEFTAGQWYLTAFCRNRNDYRAFKLERMTEVRLGDGFEPKNITPAELDRIFKEGYANKSVTVVLKFSERMRQQLAEHFRKSRITYLEDGFSLVEVLSPNEEGLMKFILGFGADCEVVEPLWLRTQLKEYIAKISGIY